LQRLARGDLGAEESEKCMAALNFCELIIDLFEPAFFQDMPALMEQYPDNAIWR
jgi:hypothetical protein